MPSSAIAPCPRADELAIWRRQRDMRRGRGKGIHRVVRSVELSIGASGRQDVKMRNRIAQKSSTPPSGWEVIRARARLQSVSGSTTFGGRRRFDRPCTIQKLTQHAPVFGRELLQHFLQRLLRGV